MVLAAGGPGEASPGRTGPVASEPVSLARRSAPLEPARLGFLPGSGLLRGAADKRAGGSGESWFARDKALHLGFSLVGTLGGGLALKALGMADDDCPVWAGASVLALGVFKEIALDGHGARGRASWRDFVVDLAGVVGAWFVWQAASES